jgi:hypothetical protein
LTQPQSSNEYQTGNNAGVTAAQDFNNNLKNGTIDPSTVVQDEISITSPACSTNSSQSYCQGFEDGFNATVNYIPPPNSNPTPQISNSQPFVGQDFGDLSNLANIPLIGGFIASKSVSTGILRDEYGIFIPWSKICVSGQQYLQQDCSQLIDQSTGGLTADGDKAVGCIRNGVLIAALAEKHGISAPTVLGLAAPIFGCGGIADLNQMQSSSYVQSLLSLVEPYVP